jgi:hypothetical protein
VRHAGELVSTGDVPLRLHHSPNNDLGCAAAAAVCQHYCVSCCALLGACGCIPLQGLACTTRL